MSAAITPTGVLGVLRKLQEIQIGGGSGIVVKRKDLVGILRNLCTMIRNGVGLPGAIATLREDPANRKYARIFEKVGESVATGSTLSTSLAPFPESFPPLLVHQLRVGERAGTLPDSLDRVTRQLEQGANLKAFLIKKLSYPLLVTVAGIGAVTFMILCVIPTFQDMYDESGATLPLITRVLVAVGETASSHYLLILGGIAAAIGGAVWAWREPTSRQAIDRACVRLPGLGGWFRSIAVLQFMDVLGNLMESGFTLADALIPASEAVSNRHVRGQIRRLHAAVRRGERFSAALDVEGGLFPPIVRQLVIVGERTGRLGPVTAQIRTHLRSDVERTTAALLGTIEPVLTVTLAAAIGGILMAVYLPMFDLIGQMH
ncbi:type II secretion system F family protein [Alienimonas californiensis]|uniref:Type II secretion system protein F n=1 Tax=Alienimonas californiensis TaxID=2527989 RepID=A0A517P8X1_9PLAN|nr:type II secretion system F family protein [Alienimonas californiensis]QDT15824.1 Type II secretion system protein F [Alienimonas californiensis]